MVTDLSKFVKKFLDSEKTNMDRIVRTEKAIYMKLDQTTNNLTGLEKNFQANILRAENSMKSITEQMVDRDDKIKISEIILNGQIAEIKEALATMSK